MGTQLQKRNLGADDYDGYPGCPEILNRSQPAVIRDIHASYLDAGADILETNTFGAQVHTLSEHGLGGMTYDVNLAAAGLAREACNEFGTKDWPRFVSGSIGPGSRLPSLGQISFDDLVASYTPQALGLLDGGVDVFQVETCQDLLQVKAALKAVSAACRQRAKEIPVIVQVTLETNGRMLLGTRLDAVIAVASGMPLMALGLNCGTGPQSMHEHVRSLCSVSPFAVSVLPNAGLPVAGPDGYVYDLTPDEFADHVARFALEYGAGLVGGCCGTGPEHIRALRQRMGFPRPLARTRQFRPSTASGFSSQEHVTRPAPLIIGERANALGSKAFRKALLEDDVDAQVALVLTQQSEGAHLADVCVAWAGRDEVGDLSRLVSRLNVECELPLCLDSTHPEAIEAALKVYAGKALINSINLEDGGVRARRVLRLAREYQAAVIALTIDEEGMARSPDRKVEVASRLVQLAEDEGLPPADLFIDVLTFTLGTGEGSSYSVAMDTLEALRRVKTAYPAVNTVLGVSNISHGLPAPVRRVLNSLFLREAVQAGLDAGIFHAGKVELLDSLPPDIVEAALRLIRNQRELGDPMDILLAWQGLSEEKADAGSDEPILDRLRGAVIRGNKASLPGLVNEALEQHDPMSIVNEAVLGGMKQVGERFGDGTMPLPFVLKSAEAVRSAMAILQPHLGEEQSASRGIVMLATVKGDIHDIGKNLVAILLGNNGYRVVDIGVDRSPGELAAAVHQHRPDFVGLSGLLVRSCQAMQETLHAFVQAGIHTPVYCGGAALTAQYVQSVLAPIYSGGVHYARDAFDAMDQMTRRG